MRSSSGLLLLALLSASASASTSQERARLVVQITVDQLREQQLEEMSERFGPGGFRFLLEDGAHYRSAFYAHAITETAPGHATLFTGANPREHGIIGNEWFDAESGQRVYNCEDEGHHVLGEEGRPGAGTSPAKLLASTIGDELRLATSGAARAFAVSVKDRGAILPAGHLGKAFWWSSGQAGFATSSYYYEELPAWARDWNASGEVDAGRELVWELSRPIEEYRYPDERVGERGYMHLGKTFPHPYAGPEGRGYTKALRYTPLGDELVASFAMQLLEAEELGRRGASDFLAVSFSSTDYVGHAYGPLSLESEDNLLRLDATLARLFARIDELVGLSNTLIVLSADHGAPDCPEYLASLGAQAGWIDSAAMVRNASAALAEEFETDEPLLRAHVTPYLWLDHAKIAELGLDPRRVATLAAEGAERTPGVARAIPRWRLEGADLPPSPMTARVRAAFHAGRGGDVYLVPEPHWLLSPGKPEAVLSSLHGSPWNYDTHVPILLAGPGVTAGSWCRPVAPRDIAPTLALLLGTKPPSAATGEPLLEALGESAH